MAEGGSSQDNSTYNTDTRLLVSRLLECPICLEQMRQPKSLPCLHSFCEECLGTYIATEVSGEMASVPSFPCPVCRKITSPVKPSEDKTKWTQHFPTNHHLTRLIDLLKRKDAKLICGPCKTTKNEDNPAQLYCKTNGMLFCEPCKSTFHDVVHKGCDITHITQTSMQHLENVSPALCPTHSGQEMDCYCEDHMFVGCNKCIITEHRRCESVKTTKEYIEKQINMDKLFDTASNSIERIVQIFDSQVDTMKRCQDGGLEDIQRQRQRINSHLDRKQVEITQQLNTIYKTEKAKVDLSKRKFQRLRASMLNTKDALRTALSRENYTDSIELYQRGRVETEAFDDLLDELQKTFTSVTIDHEIEPSNKVLDDSSVLGLGNITVDRTPKKLPEGIGYVKMLSKCQAQKKGTINVNFYTTNRSFGNGQGIMPKMSIVLMSEDRFIVSDYGHDVLRLFSRDGQVLDQFRIGTNARDMCRVDRDTVAVALSCPDPPVARDDTFIFSEPVAEDNFELNYVDEESVFPTYQDPYFSEPVTEDYFVPKYELDQEADSYQRANGIGIHIIQIQDSKLTLVSTISMPHHLTRCYGITHIAGEFAVSTPCGIYRVTKQGETTNFQSLGCYCHHLAYDEHSDRIVATLEASNVVVVTLSNGSQNEAIKTGVVNGVTGVDVDRDGNIYVCGQASNNVVLIPADGSKVRELLTSADGISKPSSISVYGDRFVVRCVSLQQQSEVHVYRMC